MNNTLEKYAVLGLLKKKLFKNELTYRLNRPGSLLISKIAIDQLSSIYKESSERGGFLIFNIENKKLVCNEFLEVNNYANNSINFSPDDLELKNTALSIIQAGGLPVVVHTHPTKLGIEQYDSKRVKFFLKASNPDVKIAGAGLVTGLEMPEAIFVKDSRFKNGFGISIYQGTVFPRKITSLSNLQIGTAAVLSLGMLTTKLTRRIYYFLLFVFAFEFIRRPRYNYTDKGDLEITYSF